jgi:hypothetical protein
MTFVTMWQTKYLVKKAKGSLKWLKFSQIDYTINQMGDFNLTFNQINHTNLVT